MAYARLTTDQRFHNRLLSALPRPVMAPLLSQLEFVELRRGETLHRADTRVRRAYFIEHGLAAVTKMMHDGRSAMVGSIGAEGMSAPTTFAGVFHTGVECTMHVAGSAFVIDAEILYNLSLKSQTLREVLQRYALFMSEQLAQIAACNRLHTLEQRCARILLTDYDSTESSTFTLTQEFLAMALGAQRPHISVVASNLQRMNLIHYRHGQMRVTNADGLKTVSCECYEAIKEQIIAFREQQRQIA